MARILIDGYNLLGAADFKGRDALVAALARYRRVRGHDVTVVFDGTFGGTGTVGRSREGGVTVLFSPITVSADDLIEEILGKKGAAAWIVVSSDRRIQAAALRARATYLSSLEFLGRLTAARTSPAPAEPETTPWTEGRDDEKNGRARTKGNPRPLPRKERQRRRRTEKI